MTALRRLFPCLTALLGGGALAAPVAAEQPGKPARSLSLDLNSLSATEAEGCRLSFVIRNGLGADIDTLVTEAVLFDAGGQVVLARITRRSAQALEIAPGATCYAIVKTVAMAPEDVGGPEPG